MHRGKLFTGKYHTKEVFEKHTTVFQVLEEIPLLPADSSSRYILDVLLGQPLKLIQVVSTSEFHEY